ncbi:MAG: Lrp/AsnC family transcriptional regulator [Phreatobacter sp.]
MKDLLHMEIAEQAPELSVQDKKILKALQEDGRLSNADLAKKVGLSPSACWNHTRRLFDTGVIKGVHALVDPKAVQRETAVLVGIVLDRSTQDSFAEFAKAARALPQVLECFLVAGEVDYFLKIRVRDLNAFNRFHSEKILALPGVRQVRTFFVLDEIKADGLLAF